MKNHEHCPTQTELTDHGWRNLCATCGAEKIRGRWHGLNSAEIKRRLQEEHGLPGTQFQIEGYIAYWDDKPRLFSGGPYSGNTQSGMEYIEGAHAALKDDPKED